MPEENVTVAVFNTHAEAEAALAELGKAGFDMERISYVGAHRHSGENGRCRAGRHGVDPHERSAQLSLPGIGPVFVAGPLAMWLIAVLENAALFGELSALGAGLYTMGLSRASALRYEAALRRSQYLVIVHGSANDVARAKKILNPSNSSASRV